MEKQILRPIPPQIGTQMAELPFNALWVSLLENKYIQKYELDISQSWIISSFSRKKFHEDAFKTFHL